MWDEWSIGMAMEPLAVTAYLDKYPAMRDIVTDAVPILRKVFPTGEWFTFRVDEYNAGTEYHFYSPIITIHTRILTRGQAQAALNPLLDGWLRDQAKPAIVPGPGLTLDIATHYDDITPNSYETPADDVISFLRLQPAVRTVLPETIALMREHFPDDKKITLYYDDGDDPSDGTRSPHVNLVVWTSHTPHYAVEHLSAFTTAWIAHPLVEQHWEAVRSHLRTDIGFLPDANPEEKSARPRYAGSDWLIACKPHLAQVMPPFARKVADMLGEWYRGIYHNMDVTRADWGNDHWIEVRHYGSLATFDNSDLTRLVLLAHRDAIRVEIRPHHHHYLMLLFHPREHGIIEPEKALYFGHPTIEEAIERFRQED